MSATKLPCGCCEGPDILTPLDYAQRPGLSSVAYRVGDYSTFLETMLARLGSAGQGPLSALTTREPSDPAIALLDAWAVVADVLTFYNERIANEGFLRTATERRSILELARLVGYTLRPGVAASTFMAFIMETGLTGETLIRAGTRVQSVPGGTPGELPQTFETMAGLRARSGWNNLQPRLKQPQSEWSIRCGHDPAPSVYLKGINTNLKTNDLVEIRFPRRSNQEANAGNSTLRLYRVGSVSPNPLASETFVTLQDVTPPSLGQADGCGQAAPAFAQQAGGQPVKALTLPGSLHPLSSQRLRRDAKSILGASSDIAQKALGTIRPETAPVINAAVANVPPPVTDELDVRAYRVRASLWGHNHPGRIRYVRDDDDERLTNVEYDPIPASRMWGIENVTQEDLVTTLFLDGEHNGLRVGDPLVVHTPAFEGEERQLRRTQIREIAIETMKVLGVSGKVTILTVTKFMSEDIATNLLEITANWDRYVKKTVVHLLPEALPAAEEPLVDPVCGGAEVEIELDGLFADLQPGQWVVVSGERTDVKDATGKTIPGLPAAEVSMVAAVTQKVKQVRGFGEQGAPVLRDLPGDKVHTFLRLATDLAYCYKRDTVKVYGNVVKATHGESQCEVLGHGDAAKSLQSFALKQGPLTFVSSLTPAGAASTLKVYVNDVEWTEAPSLVELGPSDRRYTKKTADDGKTTVTLGTGKQGARAPTGLENVKAAYRKGIGKGANVAAGRITTALDRPQGLREVINPVPATGGADPEDMDNARANVPIALGALDRLVSVRDYADFARTFAGVGKASAVRLSDGVRQVAHVTVAGVDDVPIAETSDLFHNLRRSLVAFGDPSVPVQLAVRELKLPFLSAGIRLARGYLWEPVEVALRAAVLEHFGFRRRGLGQDLLLGEVIGRMQAVPGVAFVDVDIFYAFSQEQIVAATAGLTPEAQQTPLATLLFGADLDGENAGSAATRYERLRFQPARPNPTGDGILPAQIGYFSPDLPETLILNLIEEPL